MYGYFDRKPNKFLLRVKYYGCPHWAKRRCAALGRFSIQCGSPAERRCADIQLKTNLIHEYVFAWERGSRTLGLAAFWLYHKLHNSYAKRICYSNCCILQLVAQGTWVRRTHDMCLRTWIEGSWNFEQGLAFYVCMMRKICFWNEAEWILANIISWHDDEINYNAFDFSKRESVPYVCYPRRKMFEEKQANLAMLKPRPWITALIQKESTAERKQQQQQKNNAVNWASSSINRRSPISMTAVISSFYVYALRSAIPINGYAKPNESTQMQKTSHLFSARRKTYRPYLFVRLSSGEACARGMPMCGISLTYRQTQNKALIDKKKT